jgi:succinylglutamic semialdehyde dehydrogenase
MSIWKTARFVRKGNYLHGSFIKQPEVDGYINSLNPGDLRDPIGKFPFSEASADIAVGCAREAFPGWHRSSLETRMLCLHRYRDQLAQSIEQITTYLTRETGKPGWESYAEVRATIKRIDVTLEDGLPLLEGWRLTELEGGCEFHPRGVVVVLGPYNLPLLSPNIHIISALLTGNVVVFKPSKYTPAVGQLIAEMIDRARFPRGVFNLVQGSGKVVGSRLAVHPEVDAVHLDGSLETAFELKKLTLEQPWKRLVLNTCGRGTAMVLDDADLDKAAYEIVVGAFLTTGQRRSSTTRIIATRAVADRLAARLTRLIEGLSVGHGFDEDVFIGPLISEASRRRFLLYLQATEEEGHAVLVRGGKLDLDPAGYYVRPALFRIDPAIPRKFLMGEEIVGPTLELHVVEDFNEAVAVHNRSRSGLVTSLFTRNDEHMREARYVLRTGALNFNRSTVSISARLPLEGQLGSSNGITMGLFAVRSCTYPLSYLEDDKPFDRSAIMPGIHWPELDDEDEEEVTQSSVQEEEAIGERTVSDLLIPQEEEVTAPNVPHIPPVQPPLEPDPSDLPEPSPALEPPPG